MKNVERLSELASEIDRLSTEIAKDHAKVIDGNKAAAARVRKATLALAVAGREYRQLSIEAFKA